MTFDQVDWLISQWAAWSSNGDSSLRKLAASQAKWQMDYRAPFDPENDDVPNGIVLEIDDNNLALVDRIMAAMQNDTSSTAARTWHMRNSTDDPQLPADLEAAYQRFVLFFYKVLSKTERNSLNTVCGRRHA